MDNGEAGDLSAAARAPVAGVFEPSSGEGPDSGEPTVGHFSGESFDCCVCLDLLYKPIVLACGHILCFWCVHRAMNGFMESHCPICRQPYRHFPAICQVLHNLLRKTGPTAYKKREKEVFEMESKQNCFSPQFVEHVTENTDNICIPLMEQSTSRGINAPVENDSVDKGDSNMEEMESKQNCFSPQFAEHLTENTGDICIPLMEQSTSRGINAPVENESVDKGDSNMEEMESKPNCSSPQFVENLTENTDDVCIPLMEQSTSRDINAPVEDDIVDKGDSNLEGIVKHVTQNLCISDALCAVCKQLLFRPAVLNCGHVYCEHCLLDLGSNAPRCQVCQSVHPGNLPKVCLQLSNLLEKKFPKEYAQRRESSQGLSSRGCQANRHDAKPNNHREALSMEDMLNVHIHVGCDSCGMYPIVGKRYKCKDCKEEIGFDLCEACYDTRSKLPARFNQQHRPEHIFVLDESHMLRRVSQTETLRGPL